MKDDEELRAGLQTTFIVEAKVHLSSCETFVTQIPIGVRKDLTIAQALSVLEDSTLSAFDVFSGGKAVNKADPVYKAIENGSKLLLYQSALSATGGKP